MSRTQAEDLGAEALEGVCPPWPVRNSGAVPLEQHRSVREG